MMKLYRLLAILLFIVPAIASAQGNYKPGYIITSNGDSLKGSIHYRKWAENPSEFSFINAGGDKIACTVGNTLAVVITGKASYKRFVVWVSQDRYVDLNFIPGTDNAIGVDSTKKLDTVFLKLIATGKNITLYAYTDFVKQRFFVSEKGKTPFELILHKYVEQEPKLTAIDDRKYRIQLQVLRANYAANNAALVDQIQLAEYKENELAAIVNKLNGR